MRRESGRRSRRTVKKDVASETVLLGPLEDDKGVAGQGGQDMSDEQGTEPQTPSLADDASTEETASNDLEAQGGTGAPDLAGGSAVGSTPPGPADPLLSKTVAELTTQELGDVIRRFVRVEPRESFPSGVHVNSGPPGFDNSGGHANFDPKSVLGQRGFDPTRAGVHVNSGPPGFDNSGGHANFDPKLALEATVVTLPDGGRVTLPPGSVNITVRGFRITR
jgi:hypothetical protein